MTMEARGSLTKGVSGQPAEEYPPQLSYILSYHIPLPILLPCKCKSIL